MKNEVWEKAEQIFHTALELPDGDRNSYLLRECAGDTTLFSEVKSLLKSFEKNSGFLGEPVFELGLEAIGNQTQKNLSGSIIGYYQLEEKIGAGGMGEVYKAVDARLNRRVALKFLSESLENNNAARRRLVKEAQAVAMLEHPNICAVHGIEEAGEHHFIVMQFIEGETLGEYISREKVSVEEFKNLARQIVTAVDFAHSHGVIHRDLKPGNIMLGGERQIKILDFGLAQIVPAKQIFGGDSIQDVSRFSQNGLVIGTVSYMSPEQLRGEKLDYRSDVFSVGIILYELIAGQNPFSRQSQAETIAAILNSERVALKKTALNFPETLTNLVEKCLHKDREKRFQSAAEILVELDQAESIYGRRTIFKRGQKFFVAVALAALVLLFVWAGIFFYAGQPARRSLAVLPIAFEKPPAEKEYLPDALTQSFIDKLSDLSNLKVTSRYAADSFKGKAIEPQAAGKILNVDAVFAGTIQKRADKLFLVTKLIRTSDGFAIDTYETSLEESNLIELQETVCARIIDKIKSKLTDEDRNKLFKKDTENAEAKRLYFLGRFYLNRRADDDLKTAIQAFTDATNLDPAYVKAWTGLADAHLFTSLPDNKDSIPPKEAIKSAKSAARKALEIDNTVCETYNSLGMISLKYDWNWDEAAGYFRQAINCNAELLPARIGLINVLQITGRFDEALLEAQKAKELEPLLVSSDLNLAMSYYDKHDYKQMDKILSDLLEKNPGSWNRVTYLQSYEFLQTGKVDKAIEVLEKMYNSDKVQDKILASAPLGYAYAKANRKDDALKIIRNLELFAKDRYVPAQEKAIIYVGLRDFVKAFENLNKACEERYPSLPALIFDPLIDEIKTDEKFSGIKKCANL